MSSRKSISSFLCSILYLFYSQVTIPIIPFSTTDLLTIVHVIWHSIKWNVSYRFLVIVRITFQVMEQCIDSLRLDKQTSLFVNENVLISRIENNRSVQNFIEKQISQFWLTYVRTLFVTNIWPLRHERIKQLRFATTENRSSSSKFVSFRTLSLFEYSLASFVYILEIFMINAGKWKLKSQKWYIL